MIRFSAVRVHNSLLVLLLWISVCLSALAQNQPQVGYSVITARQGTRLPVATVLFSFRFPDTSGQPLLSAEAGVPAVEAIRSGQIFVDESATSTGVALANPSAQPVNATLTVRNALGTFVLSTPLLLGAGEQLARYVNDLSSNLPAGFVGSLTFECQGNGRLAAVAIRQSVNGRGQPIFATLPVADLDRVQQGSSMVFPHLGAGGILSTQLILINPTAQRMTGQIRLFGTDGNALNLQFDGRAGSEFDFTLEPGGTFQGRLTRNGDPLAGYAVVSVDSGNALPAGTALFQFRDGSGNLDSEAGVGAIPSTPTARIFVDTNQTDTGVAIANSGNSAVDLTFELLDGNGIPIRSTPVNLGARRQLSVFVSELFEGLPTGFTGLMEIRSSAPIFPITLKFTINRVGAAILTTLPVADLTRPVTAATLVFPQVGFGGGLETRLILINTEQSTSRITLSFTNPSGAALTVPITGTSSSSFDIDLQAGAGRQLRPGNTAAIAEIRVDPASALSSEVATAVGTTSYIRPAVIDTAGQQRDDFPFSFNSLASDVAVVDAAGKVDARKVGFATLTISSGAAVLTTTISVVSVSSGTSGFSITGITEDPSRRIYMADTSRHRILLAQRLDQTPQPFAGIANNPGFQNGPPLSALFRNPSFIALNKGEASLYISDSQNHVIRVIRQGRVETLAGRENTPGAADGPLAQARFRNPQGLTLDERGFLWVVDSGNHTVRRVDLVRGVVSTVAGSEGAAGSSDGSGAAARFNGPIGIALEPEPISAQLARQQRGQPAPPTSVIVADTGNNLLRRILEDGTVSTLGTSVNPSGLDGDDRWRLQTTPTTRIFESPRGIAIDPAGNIYVSETTSGRVRTLLRNGSVAPAGPSDAFSAPQAIAVSASGRLLVADATGAGREIGYGGPAITSVSPSRISVTGGTAVTIQGSNFSPESLVIVGGIVISNARVLDTRRITFSAPAGLPSGRMTITVQNRGGLAQSALLIDPVPLAGLASGRVTTVVGGSTYVGDGLPALGAILSRPALTAVDAAGNVYVADALANRIRRVDAVTGIITTIAGTGRAGYFGDGQSALTAQLGLPLGVAVDEGGNIYISDSLNLRVRRVDSRTGVITTVAGNGDYGFSGDGGPADEAELTVPLGLAVDSQGNLFIADSEVVVDEPGNSRIRRVDAVTGIITTVAGDGEPRFGGDGGPAIQASFHAPAGLAFDSSGNLLIADVRNHRIRRIDAGDGRIDATDSIRTLAGTGQPGFSGDNGPAVSARLNEPGGLAVDLLDRIFFTDTSNNRVRRVDAAGTITTVAGNGASGFSGDGGPAVQASFDAAIGVSVDAGGNIYISDFLNDRIRRVSSTSSRIETFAGSGNAGPLGDNGPAIHAGLGIPLGITFDPSGDLVVADYLGSVIRRVDAAGVIRSVAGNGQLDFAGDGGPARSAALQLPSSVVADAGGNLFVADQGNDRIRRIDALTGRISTIAGNGFQGFSGDGGPADEASLHNPTRVLLDHSGNLFINDFGNNRIRRIDLNSGLISTVAGDGDLDIFCFLGVPPPENVPANSIPLGIADGMAVDPAGNLLIADSFCNRIRSVNRNTGLITSVAGNGCNPFLENCPPNFDGVPASEVSLCFPTGLTVDGAGDIFISDLIHVLKMNGATQRVSRIGGTGLGFSGDGGPATNASFFNPADMAVSPAGALFVADSINGRIRAIPGVATPPARRQTLFFDDLESGADRWRTSGTTLAIWFITENRSASPTHSLMAEDVGSTSDQVLFLADPVQIPATATSVRLSFQHFFELEADDDAAYDGGVVEISTNGGTSWTDAGPLFVSNGYNRVLSTQFGNPLGGRPGFSGSTGGFVISELDLISFRGSNLLIRFRLATDQDTGAEGWYVDDVRLTATLP